MLVAFLITNHYIYSGILRKCYVINQSSVSCMCVCLFVSLEQKVLQNNGGHVLNLYSDIIPNQSKYREAEALLQHFPKYFLRNIIPMTYFLGSNNLRKCCISSVMHLPSFFMLPLRG